MPLVLTFSIEDAGGDIAPASFYIEADPVFTLAQLDSQVELVWDTIRPMLNGVLVSVNLTYKPDISSFTNNTPTAVSDVEEKARFNIRVCSTNEIVHISLPTIRETIFTNAGAGKAVDFTNGDVGAFYTLVQDGFGDDNGGFVNAHDQDLCQIVSGVQKFGKG